MADVRDNWAVIVGSAVTAAAMAVGWLLSSGVLLNLIFLVLGSGITYSVQSRTQKKAWQREYSVKIAETVYGPVYRDVKSMVDALGQGALDLPPFGFWAECQRDHKYFMVDEKFRNRLDIFQKRVGEYDGFLSESRNKALPGLLHEEADKFFKTGDKPVGVLIDAVRGDTPVNSQLDESVLVDHLIHGTHPGTDLLNSRKPELKIVSLRVTFGRGSRAIPGGTEADGKFDEFWQNCLTTVVKDFKFREKADEMRHEAEKLRQDLARRIEKPWKI
jgi:hypothetical protein